MSWELLLLLLLPLAGVAAQDPRYQVSQPVSVSAPAGSSVTLPCTFTYPHEIEPLQDLRVSWRRGGFYGEFIYNHTENGTHPDYRGRIALVGDPRGSRTASICIDRLRESDANVYVCQVRVQRNNGQWEQWRNITGTILTVTGRITTPTQGPGYETCQPVSDSEPGGSSITLPCTLTYPDHIEPPTGPAALGTAHLVLLGLGSAAAKAGVGVAVFALGRRLGWGCGPASAL